MHNNWYNGIADESINELDSFMFQTVGHTAIDVLVLFEGYI